MNLLPVIDDRFQLQSVAGSGGMGVVYRALDTTTGTTVAIKVLRTDEADAAARFLREAQLLAGMTHPRIVRHVAHGHTLGGEPYLAMEWLNGEDLRERLARGPLGTAESALLGADIAEALAHAHNQNVIHRDLKPANIYLIDGKLQASRLLDFGIARVEQAADDATRTGTVLGTPAYMAPEQARSERTLDARADLFSLGCVMYECLTGRAPFVAGSAMAVLIKVLLEEPPSLAELRDDVPAPLALLVGQLLAKDPSERPRTAEVAAALLRELAHATRESAPTTVSVGLTRQERRIVTLMVARAPDLDAADPGETRRDGLAGLGHLDATLAAALGPVDDVETVRFESTDLAATVQVMPTSQLSALQRKMAAIGIRLHRLLDGTLLATAQGTATAAEQAALTAHGALLLAQSLPQMSAVIATGYGLSSGDASGEVAIGEAIEQAAQVLAVASQTGQPRLILDDATVGLLGGRFEVERSTQATGTFVWQLKGAQRARIQAASLLGRSTPCVGRGRELAILRALLDCCMDEGGSKILLTGDPGYGKSRLVQEFLQRVRRDLPKVQVWQLRAEAIDQDSPYAGLAAVLAQAADLQAGMSDAERTLRMRARIDRAAQPAQRELVMDLARVCLRIDTERASERLRAAREDAAIMADLVRDGFSAWMRVEAQNAPLVVVVDDLQWVDAPSLAAMRLVHDTVMEEPVLFIGLARPEIFERFPFLQGNARVLQVRLGPLSPRACAQLIRTALPKEATEEVVQRLTQLSAGEVYYLEELIRAVAVGQDAVPTTVLAMAQARIDAIDPDSRRVLRAAAVFGMRVWADGVAALAGGRVSAQLQQLVAAEILVPSTRSGLQGQMEFSFRQASLREAAYATLTEADRTLGHRLAARWLQQVGGVDAVVLANHFDLGGEAEKAQVYLSVAAENAMAAHDHAGARRWVERGLALGVNSEGKARLQLAQAELDMGEGHAYDALATAQVAVEGFQPGSRLWYRAMTEIGRAMVRSGQRAKVPGLVAAFLQATPEEAAVEAAVYAAARLCVNVLFLDMIGPGEQLIAFADELQARAQPPIGLAAQARLAGARSSQFALAGALEKAAEQTRFALEAFRSLNDRRNASAQTLDLGVMLLRSGQPALAEPLIAEAIAESDEINLPAAGAVGRTWHGLTLLKLGQHARALKMLQLADGQLRDQSIALPHCWCLHALAWAHLQGGDLEEAAAAAERLQVANRHVPPMWAPSLALLALVRLRQGQGTEALQLAKDGVRVWQEGLPNAERGIAPHHALAVVLAALGKKHQSANAAKEGWALVEQLAAQFSDDKARLAYLHGDPLRVELAGMVTGE